jgi:hypothetical protein
MRPIQFNVAGTTFGEYRVPIVFHTAAALVHLACFVYGMWLSAGTKFDKRPPSTKIVRTHYNYARTDYSSASYYYSPLVKTYEEAFPSPLLMHTIVASCTFVSHTLQALLLYFDSPWYNLNDIEEKQRNPVRWVEYAITATLITLANAASTGEMGVPLFSCIVAAGVVQQLIGLILERLRVKATQVLSATDRDQILNHRLLYGMGGVLQLGVTVFLVQRITPPSEVGNLQSSGTVVYAVFYSLFGLLAFVDVVMPWYRGQKLCGNSNELESASVGILRGAPKGRAVTGKQGEPYLSYGSVDALYIVLSLTSKQALFWITVADGLRWMSPTPALSAPIAAWLLGVAIPVAVLIFLSIYIIKYKSE